MGMPFDKLMVEDSVQDSVFGGYDLAILSAGIFESFGHNGNLANGETMIVQNSDRFFGIPRCLEHAADEFVLIVESLHMCPRLCQGRFGD